MEGADVHRFRKRQHDEAKEWHERLVEVQHVKLFSLKQLAHLLSDMGLTPIEGRRLKLKNRANHFVWYNRNTMTDAEARKRVRDHHEGDRDFSDVPF